MQAEACRLQGGSWRDGGTEPWWLQAMGTSLGATSALTKTASVAAWLQPAEQSVLQVGSKENPRKGPKNLFVHVANTQKCVHLCCVSSKSFPPKLGSI